MTLVVCDIIKTTSVGLQHPKRTEDKGEKCIVKNLGRYPRRYSLSCLNTEVFGVSLIMQIHGAA